MRLTFNWNFEFDDSDLDPKAVDLEKLAKSVAFKELLSQINTKDITEEDFIIQKRKDIKMGKIKDIYIDFQNTHPILSRIPFIKYKALNHFICKRFDLEKGGKSQNFKHNNYMLHGYQPTGDLDINKPPKSGSNVIIEKHCSFCKFDNFDDKEPCTSCRNTNNYEPKTYNGTS